MSFGAHVAFAARHHHVMCACEVFAAGWFSFLTMLSAANTRETSSSLCHPIRSRSYACGCASHDGSFADG
jgi:hypothetical protein